MPGPQYRDDIVQAVVYHVWSAQDDGLQSQLGLFWRDLDETVELACREGVAGQPTHREAQP